MQSREQGSFRLSLRKPEISQRGKNWPGATPKPERAFGRTGGRLNGVAPGQFGSSLLRHSRRPGVIYTIAA